METELLDRIEELRNQMNQVAAEKGLAHKEVLLISQEIDSLLNQLNKLNYHSLSGKNEGSQETDNKIENNHYNNRDVNIKQKATIYELQRTGKKKDYVKENVLSKSVYHPAQSLMFHFYQKGHYITPLML